MTEIAHNQEQAWTIGHWLGLITNVFKRCCILQMQTTALQATSPTRSQQQITVCAG